VVRVRSMLRLALGLLGTSALVQAAAGLVDVPFVTGPQTFRAGDQIVVLQVRAASAKMEVGERVVVVCKYELKSEPRARIALSVTQTSGPTMATSTSPAQWADVERGAGELELVIDVHAVGCLHLVCTTLPDRKSFGTVYFGTREQVERVKNMKLDIFRK
jgi:hypothetical protein